MNPTLIYLDNGATTQTDPVVVGHMLPYLTEQWGNPSSLHRMGVSAREALDESRRCVAKAVGCTPSEIVFTSGGTESNATAILGVALSSRKRHIVMSAIEHSSVLGHRSLLVQQGFEVSLVHPTATGHVDPDTVVRALRPDTALVCVQHANNEIGTIQPTEIIGPIIKQVSESALFLVDAVQSFTKVPLDVHTARIDFLTFSSHKIHGPKGAGGIYIRRGLKLRPLFGDGSQEHGFRPGTENVSAIVGFAHATQIALEKRGVETPRIKDLRDHLVQTIAEEIPNTTENGVPGPRLAHQTSINFHGARAETLVHLLEAQGIIVSSGAACHAASQKPSHVLKAVGIVRDEGTLRFSLSRFLTLADIDTTIHVLKNVVPLARSLR